MTSAASRNCGTAFGETNDVASILATPVCERRSMISTLRSVGIQFGSIWNPSRATTSWMKMRGLMSDHPRCAQPRDVLVAVADAAQHLIGMLSQLGADPLHRAGRLVQLRDNAVQPD